MSNTPRTRTTARVLSALGLGVIVAVVLLVWRPWGGDAPSASAGPISSTTAVSESADGDDSVDDTSSAEPEV